MSLFQLPNLRGTLHQIFSWGCVWVANAIVMLEFNCLNSSWGLKACFSIDVHCVLDEETSFVVLYYVCVSPSITWAKR